MQDGERFAPLRAVHPCPADSRRDSDILDAIVPDDLIGLDPDRLVDRARLDAPPLDARLGPDHEEGRGLHQPMQPAEVDEAAVHHVDRAGLRHDRVQDVAAAVSDSEAGGSRKPNSSR